MALDFSVADEAFKAVDRAGQSISLVLATGDNLAKMKDLLGVGLAIEFAIACVMSLIDGGQAAAKSFIRGAILISIFYGFVTHWTTVMAPFPMAWSDELVLMISGQSTESLGQSAIVGFGDAISSLTATMSPSQQPLPAPASPTGSQSVWQSLAAWWDTNPVSSVFVEIADSMTGSAFTIINILLLGGTFALVFGSIMLANVSIYLALALGPLMFALSGVRWFGQLWKNWLAFLLGAIALKPVLALLVKLSLLILDYVKNVAATSPTSQTPQGLIMILIFMMLLVMLMLVTRAQSITSQLFGGVGDSIGQMADTASGMASGVKSRVMSGGGGTPPVPKVPGKPPGGVTSSISKATPGISQASSAIKGGST